MNKDETNVSKEISAILVGSAIVFISMAVVYKAIDARQPSQIHILKYDLNQDGIKGDAVIETKLGRSIPMYKLDETGRKYVSGAEMLKRDPASVVNYQGIEARLNQK